MCDKRMMTHNIQEVDQIRSENINAFKTWLSMMRLYITKSAYAHLLARHNNGRVPYSTIGPARSVQGFHLTRRPGDGQTLQNLTGIEICALITVRVAKRAKVMFSQACVTQSVQLGGGGETRCIL